MKILSIETSCDETAISIVEAKGNIKNHQFKVLSNITLSQAKLHAKYGGVFPSLAKREHSRNLVPVLQKVLEQGFGKHKSQTPNYRQITNSKLQKIKQILKREPELLEQFLEFIPTIKKPAIDKIAVTYGPGLEPALWVGINFAKALSEVWSTTKRIPVVPVNHMEGHIASVLPLQNRGNSKSETNSKLKKKLEIRYSGLEFPAVALLISGGHTELVLVKEWGDYKILGQTRDDAVGEVFDKVARMLDLPYPGGPEISRLADQARNLKPKIKNLINFPRPMINSPDLDFSFSGLKTAVLYHLQKYPAKTTEEKSLIAEEFELAVVEIFLRKIKKAIEQSGAKTLIVAGGVSANKFIRSEIERKFGKEIEILIPEFELSTDNALMIAIAGYLKILRKSKTPKNIKAEGNLSFN